MMRVRLRPDLTSHERDGLYAATDDHRQWPDHVMRVALTVALGQMAKPRSIADLSCGDASIVSGIMDRLPVIERLGSQVFLGDLAPDPTKRRAEGPIEETIETAFPGVVDLFVCTETIEHVNDPDRLLWKIRPRARHLLLSTPLGETGTGNPEHLWGWDAEAVEAMLVETGWSVEARVTVASTPFVYTFGLWLAV